MTIDTLLKRATIEFPRPLSLDETEQLLMYIAERMPADINYKKEQFMYLHHDPESGDTRPSKSEGTASLWAMIHNTEKPAAFDNFIVLNGHDTEEILAFRFNLVPSWEIIDYRSEILELWDETRKLTTEYFAHQK